MTSFSVDPKDIIFKAMAEKWPSAIVARTSIQDFSGGVLQPEVMRNLDSKGEGPPKIRINRRKIAYPVDSLLEWMKSRVEVI